MASENGEAPGAAERRSLVGDGVESEAVPSYGASKDQEEDVIVVAETEPQTRAAFFETPSYYSMFEYCCRGNLVKIIIGLLISTIILFLTTIILLTMVIMYATHQIGCEAPSPTSGTITSK